ncbi:MAG: hypothetical protein HOP15_10010, partial [Planctomycetes bacterium]|nr:hypothetical protein [Planctomycetota bacterium]
EEEDGCAGDSEEDGDFAFQLEAARPRLFVRPSAESGLLPAWGLPAEDAAGSQAFVLRRARRLAVEVRDLAGAPVVAAEVRVYERRGEAAVIALGETDRDGRAVLLAPALADVAVIAPGNARLARWHFDCSIPAEGSTLAFTLPPATSVSGQVLGAAGPLEGIVLVAREDGLEGGWNGFALSDAEGHFALPFTAAASTLSAYDPAAEYLPGRLRFDSTRASPALALELERGAPLVVRVSRQGLPLGARVWSWCPTSASWSAGARTGPSGRAKVPVGARFGVHAEPLDPAYASLEVWDVPHETGTLQLEAGARP